MSVVTIKFNTTDIEKLEKFMKENQCKNKSSAIRECINIASSKIELKSLVYDITIKLNTVIHNENIIRKLLEQLFTNTGFVENYDIKKDTCLKDFYEKNNTYKNNFLG